MKTTQKYYRIDRAQISFVKFIIEAYDGAAVLRTVDPAAGIVAFHISPGCEALVDMILGDLKQDILIEEMEAAWTCEHKQNDNGFGETLLQGLEGK